MKMFLLFSLSKNVSIMKNVKDVFMKPNFEAS